MAWTAPIGRWRGRRRSPRLGSAFAPLANAVLANPLARWLLEKMFGLSRRRRLPAFAARSFLRRATRVAAGRAGRARRGRASPTSWMSSPTTTIRSSPRPSSPCCTTTASRCTCRRARAAAAWRRWPTATWKRPAKPCSDNLLVLSDLAREGYPILCSEPTAALMLRHDALDLLDDADARLVAAQTVECTAFLWDLHQQGQSAHRLPCRCRSPSAIMCRAISRRWAGRRWGRRCCR